MSRLVDVIVTQRRALGLLLKDVSGLAMRLLQTAGPMLPSSTPLSPKVLMVQQSHSTLLTSMVLLIVQVVPLPQLRLSRILFEDFVVVQAPSPYLLLTAGRSWRVVEVSRLNKMLVVTT